MTPKQISFEYRAKYGMEMPTLKLARIMYKENRLIFKDVEDARGSLRYIEGKRGNGHLTTIIQKGEDRPKNPYSIPKSDQDKFPNYIIKGHSKGLIIGDVHLPYHDEEAITAMLDYAKKEKPDFVFINGDLLDFHSVSYFMKDPRKKRFSEELDMMKEFIEILKKALNCKIYFKFGNHEERYNHFLFTKAHELAGVEEFNLENIIKTRVPDVQIITDRRLVVIGGLPFVHGHEFGRGVFNPVNASRGLFLQAKHSAVKSDCHATSEHTEKDIMGKIMTTFSIGCLCGLTPYFASQNRWNHGFAMIDILGDKKYKLRNYRIYNGEVL